MFPYRKKEEEKPVHWAQGRSSQSARHLYVVGDDDDRLRSDSFLAVVERSTAAQKKRRVRVCHQLSDCQRDLERVVILRLKSNAAVAVGVVVVGCKEHGRRC